MTVLDEVRETFKATEIGTEFTTAEIKHMVKMKFGRNPGSVIPSDYSYNMDNKGKGGSLKNFNLFLQTKRGIYKYVGENYRS
ncbi:MAG: hypothetical protein E7443_06960 [Ruminococcaceae bacterium]|nr:hypothetical protein [Oscillospiraceae bacterium]